MFEQLDFALGDGIPHYSGTKCGARECRRTPVDEKERESITIYLRCATVDPKTGEPMNLVLGCGRDGLQ